MEIKVLDGEHVEVVVSQDGKQVEIIDPRTRNTLTLRPGTYEIGLLQGGNDLRVTPEKVTLRRGKKVIVEVSRRPPMRRHRKTRRTRRSIRKRLWWTRK